MQTSAHTPTAKFLIALPDLAEGEKYAGIVLDDAGHPTHHLILIAQQPDGPLAWNDAVEWATEIGAGLPTRQEQALLYANLKHAFEADWYWSGEQYAGYASLAWGQGFDDGDQGSGDKGDQGRVRAVRRFLID